MSVAATAVKELKAGVIGLGVGERHLAGYKQIDGVTVKAIADIDPAKLELKPQRFRVLLYGAFACRYSGTGIDQIPLNARRDPFGVGWMSGQPVTLRDRRFRSHGGTRHVPHRAAHRLRAGRFR